MTDSAAYGTTLDFALAYATLGLRVLPIKPGTKRPPMNEWVEAATNDEQIITNWFTGPLYRDHGVGLAMGRQPGGRFVFALDVDEHDPAHSGSETLADLEVTHGSLPDTVRSLTGSGGLHLLFAADVEVRNGVAGDGLDVRGEGGQIVVAPSVHPTTNIAYEWEHGFAPWEHDIADAPEWLIEVVSPRVPTTDTADSRLSGQVSLHPFADPDQSNSPAEWLRANWDWASELGRAGWTEHHVDRRSGDVFWTRPGKDRRDGESAVLHMPDGPFVVWSLDASMAVLRQVGRLNADGSVSLSPLDFYAGTYHNGDRSAASSAILRQLNPPAVRHLTPPPAPAIQSNVRRRMRTRPASSIQVRRTRWLWDQRVPIGALSLLAGPEGLGKSTLAYWLTARVTRGELDGESHGVPRSVLVCATEDSWSQTIVPRLMAADADLDRVHQIDVEVDEALTAELSLPADLGELAATAGELDASLVVLDPLMSRLDTHIDSHRDGEVRQALEPLVRTCEEAKLACLGLIHHNKSGATNPLDMVMASKAFTAVARSVHTVVRDPEDDDMRLFGTIKSNLGQGDLSVRTFSISSWSYPTLDEHGAPDGVGTVGRLQWGLDASTSIQAAIRKMAASKENAVDWLRDYMNKHGPRVNAADVFTAADEAEIPRRSLQRARQKLKLDAEDVGGSGRGRQTLWFDPADRRLSVSDDSDKPW